ncbi:IclR family transcriptional regulator domain-containing protein [Rhodococcus marinonascens]|uniref:IclR family transcriptional regulator domain-containing protein n=1 Tax=Rhodococcus marinonascens TaxID=38311 RepID=UPI000A030345|nr:IclR family transcriptional regulator C-terminal domain-containing protein [Rhodococcus marinonascens]
MTKNREAMPAPTQSRDHIQALGRGLEVLKIFGTERRPLSVTDIAELAGITRTAARRFILTLEYMGYLSFDGNAYAVRPTALEVGDAYIQSNALLELAHPYLEKLTEQTHETVSLTVLHRDHVIYVDRVQADRVLTVNIVVGTSLPAYITATGRVLLADLPDDGIEAYLRSVEEQEPTVDTKQLREKISAARERGWCLADQELTAGIRSIAVPVRSPDGSTVAALNVSAQAARISKESMRGSIVAALQEAAAQIQKDLAATRSGRST